MAPTKNVVVLGARGDVGQQIVHALIGAYFHVTITSRSSSPIAGLQTSIRRVELPDYESLPMLVEAFTGQDAIVEAYNPAAAAHQGTIVKAAIQAGVQHIITPDFSSDTFNENVSELQIFEPKIRAQKELEALASGTSLHWSAIITGPFYDWAIRKGLFWINARERKVTIFGSGNQAISMSAIETVGTATVAVLRNPDDFINRTAYFADHTVSTSELTELVDEICKPEEWEIVHIPIETLYQQGMALWEADTKNGVQDRLNTMAYQLLRTYGVFEEHNRYGADFYDKVEPGFGKPKEELKRRLKELLV